MKRLLTFKPILFICLLSFIATYWINEINLNSLISNQLREDKTIITNDDASYLSPVKNFINNNQWKDNSIGKQSFFIRPPGYGIIYYSLVKISNFSIALTLLKWLQILLFTFSVYWFFFIAKTLLKSDKYAYIIAIVYGLFPFTNGFVYYTLTEGVTPAFILYFIYLLIKANQTNLVITKRKYYLCASLFFAFLLLVRPALGFFGLLIPVFIIHDYSRKGVIYALTRVVIYCLIAFSLTLIWQIRNYQIAGSYVGLHSIYYKDANSIYRPTLKSYWDFPLGIGQQGHEVYSYMVPMWQAAINGDTSIIYIHNALESFPKKINNYFGKKRLMNIFKKYQRATVFQGKLYQQKQPMPNEIPEVEKMSIAAFSSLVSDLKNKFWLDYYFISPAKVFKVMAFHSNLNLHIFQNTYRGNFFVEILRYLCFGIHSLLFILLIISILFINKIDWRLSSINFILLIYVFYLCFFQRGIEERYTLPILALLLIVGVSTFRNLVHGKV